MRLEHRLTIAAEPDDAWAAFNDPARIARCFPGAVLTDQNGDNFAATAHVKLGPLAMTCKGTGSFQERDTRQRRVVIVASGRDTRGNGTASAAVTGTLRPVGPGKTEVSVITDLKVTGRPAQFGRGVISDAADSVIGQFATTLADSLALPAADGEPRPAASKAPEALGLLGAGGVPLLRRIAPALVVLAAIGGLLAAVLRRSRR